MGQKVDPAEVSRRIAAQNAANAAAAKAQAAAERERKARAEVDARQAAARKRIDQSVRRKGGSG